ncbi:hypothetical protein [Actinospica robiniae]|uniref:hypothetical protein n=1 Tax=Actinospica robiniae TaxID=304901 RepID=UPI000558204D|nr:hypothetical protein [Actinospica robiniae]
MSALAEFVASFAKTGRIGPLRVGMEATGLSAALADLGLAFEPPPERAEFAARFESLEVSVSEGRVILLGLDHDGDLVLSVPPSLLDAPASEGSRLARSEMVKALSRADCAWAVDAALTFPGHQSAIRTAIGASLVFAAPDLDVTEPDAVPDEEYLASIYMSFARGT